MQRDCGISATVAFLFLLKIFNNQYSRGPIKQMAFINNWYIHMSILTKH